MSLFSKFFVFCFISFAQQNYINVVVSFAQRNYINVVVRLWWWSVPFHFHQKFQLQQSRAAEQLLNIVVFRNYFTLEFFRLFFNFTSFLSKSPTAAVQSSWAALKHSRFSELFYLCRGDEKNINFWHLEFFRFFFSTLDGWLGRWLQRKKDGWKDGTKTDNGICILTMPTQNYFTFSMERKSDT